MRLIVLALTLFAVVAPVSGAQTPWQELAPGVRVRLVSSDMLRPDGTTLIALEVDMPDTVKTYWRIPGEAGIPTEFDWTGSSGISHAEVVWPYPTIDTRSGLLDYVYYGQTVLPVSLTVDGDAPAIVVSVIMGVCSEICIPANADFSLPLSFVKPDRGESLRINQALALAPLPWTGDVDPITGVTWDAEKRALLVGIGDQSMDAGSMIADVGDASVLFGPPQKSPEPGSIVLPLLGNDDIPGLGGKTVRFTFMTADGPYEVSLPIGGAAL